MQITHEEAHKLVQFDADNALNSQERLTLSAHLSACLECRAYEGEIKALEEILLPIMKKQWNIRPVPLSISTILAKRSSKPSTSTILTTRTVAMSVVVLTFIFSIWQFTMSGERAATPLPISVPPVPTPSTQSTSTKIMFQNCDGVLYTVQENDTLEGIAYQFSTSKEDLMAANNLLAETVTTGTELIVPLCNFTPTGTTHPTILTTTYTPSIHPTTFTPDG
jgi:LysM repeat protein